MGEGIGEKYEKVKSRRFEKMVLMKKAEVEDSGKSVNKSQSEGGSLWPD